MTLLTIPQVAVRLQVSERTVYRYISDNSLPTVQIGRGVSKTRVRETDLIKFVNQRALSA